MSNRKHGLPVRYSAQSFAVRLTSLMALTSVTIALPAGGAFVGALFWHDLNEQQQAYLAVFAISIYIAVLCGLMLLFMAYRAPYDADEDNEDDASDRRISPPQRQGLLPPPVPLPATGIAMIAALTKREPLRVLQALESVPVSGLNDRDTANGMTILHHAAAGQAHAIVHALGARGDVDFTVEDAKGRTASALALEIAGDHKLAAYLLEREAEQLRQRGELTE